MRAAGTNIASHDARDLPAYPLAEAARYVRIAAATLRSWVVGRPYPKAGGVAHFRPLLILPDRNKPVLAFNNLVEAHILRALRTEHGVSIQAVRKALDYAERELGIRRLLLRRELRTNGGELLLDRYGELINLTRSGQLAMKKLLEAHLHRVVWDADDFPRRLFPFVHNESVEAPRNIAIDPLVAFGRPVVMKRGVTTGAIAARIDAGEDVEEIAADYNLEPRDVEEAVLYERAA